MRPAISLICAVAAVSGVPAAAKTPAIDLSRAEAQVLDLSKQLIAIRSVRGPDNRTPDALRAVATALTAAGWQGSEIEIVPVDDTAYLISTWAGSDLRLKPLVISGHLDVVEADPKDWTRNPFTPIVENGYLFGRGASDMKYDAALATSTLIALRQAGYKPRRTIVLQFSGDEETTMKTSRLIAERLKGAEMVINIDGGGGTFDEASGKPVYWTWQGAEKTYDDYQLEMTNPGGHSSAPRPDNAIVQLAQALERIGNYRFPAEQSPLTKAYFEKAAQFESNPALAAAMRAFATNPGDAAALETLRANPAYVGKVGTTCVPTMITGGHAQNALPQRATANINCRVFPGHSREEIRAQLEKIAAVPGLKVTAISGEDSISSPASPLRPDFIAAVNKALGKAWPNTPIFPSQASGASDSMWYRALGVPSYGASPVFSKDSDDFAHGLNERIALRNTRPALTYYASLFTDLAQ
ncbi:M20/M25/M40 family metallo-hydrolase [Novosphingobium aquiterrae]|uniref:M20/M25/M40 family metallo-hydrolase n=1 Tax=Novosphingobium aquiterrae TaxID=624388 RepID=A0ABV6PKZ2_9SPHN